MSALHPRHGSAGSPNLKAKRASRSGLGTSLPGPFLLSLLRPSLSLLRPSLSALRPSLSSLATCPSPPPLVADVSRNALASEAEGRVDLTGINLWTGSIQ